MLRRPQPAIVKALQGESGSPDRPIAVGPRASMIEELAKLLTRRLLLASTADIC
jgi:hypothetical protein